MAGSRLAAELHGRDGAAKIVVLGAEPHRAYNRIMLSNLLAGKMLGISRATLYRKLKRYKITMRSGEAVQAASQ